jgi:hypothetical protein
MFHSIKKVVVRTTKTRSRTEGEVKTVKKVHIKRKETRTVKVAKLKFGRGNAKLDDAIFTFSLPAGHSCPFANECLSRADRHTGRIKDGPNTSFRCYAASMESRHKTVRDARWHNLEALRACGSKDEMVALILDSLSPYAGFVRVHDSGDFFSQGYFDAWAEVARQRPSTTFYAYTKSLPFWVARLGDIPSNFVLTASKGGRHDHLIDERGLRYAEVVFSAAEAEQLGLELDHDDSHAMVNGLSFALLIHGTQPGGTPAAKAVAALRQEGEYGYGARADRIRGARRVSLAVVSP